MIERPYYSQRKSNAGKITIGFESLVDYFDHIHTYFFNRAYFHKVPHGNIYELNLYSIELFNKEYILPFHKSNEYIEEDIFDLIEFFYDSIDMPNSSEGGFSISENEYLGEMENGKLTKEEIQSDYRERINRVLSKYDKGYELTKEGYIRELLNNGLEELIDSPQVLSNDSDSEQRIKHAKKTFFKHGATDADKRGAILEVGAVLEKLRDSKQLNLTSKDTGDLFTVLNGFTIRHNRKDQKPDYDKEVFYPWMFYNLLAAVDASLKLQMKKNEN